MDYALKDYHLRPSSRRNSPSRGRESNGYHEPRTQGYVNGWQPPSGRSTPSAAVRRALQVLDESYRQQGDVKRFRSRDRQPSFRRGRSRSPSKSRSPSPVRRYLRDSMSPEPREPITPPRILEIERDNLQDALGDSESRRNVLLRKLAETQRTMEIQNDAVRKSDMDLRESKAATKLLQQVQDELETKVQFLEKERSSHLNRQLQDAEDKETLRREADNFHHEMKRLQCQLDLMEADKDDRIREINRARDEVRNIQESNRKLLETKSVLGDENAMLKESLSVAKQRIEILEKEKTHALDGLRNLQESQQAIINRNTELSNRLNLAEDSLVQMRNKFDESEMSLQACKHDMEMFKEKSSKLGYKLAEIQTNYKEVQGDMDRSNRYISELERTLQSMKEVNQKLKENKVSLEDNLTTLHSDLAKTRLGYSKANDEKTQLSEELETVKKGQRNLVATLAEVRQQLSTKEEEVLQHQAAKKVESQRLSLLETRNKQGEMERGELTTRLVSLQETHETFKIRAEEDARRNLHQLRELTVERDRLEVRSKDAESRAERITMELTATIEHDQSQLDHWRETCTKLTTLIEERDRDQRESTARIRASEEALEQAETETKSLEKQLSTLQGVQHEAAEMKSENKRLLQEIKENKQMIAVLEMERDVLVKSPTKSSDSDLLGAEVRKIQADLKVALDRLNATDASKESSAKDEAHRKGLENLEADLKRAQENNKLLDDRLLQVKKEAETLHSLMEARTDTHEREVRKMERERERLESRIRSLEDEARVLRSSLTSSARSPNHFGNSEELMSLRVEVSRLKRELDEKEQTYLVTKGQLVVAQNARRVADDRATTMESQLEASGGEKSPRRSLFADESVELEGAKTELRAKAARLEAVESECAILRSRVAELSEVRTKQETLIKTLRKQLKGLKDSPRKTDPESIKSEEGDRSLVVELASTRRDLQRAFEDISTRDRELSQIRKSLVNAQKQEQRARQERDELKGRTIIMESITDSSGELRRELENLRKEKIDMEKQLHAFIKSKPSQTPHSSLTLNGDLDKEMEKQYKAVCERNKWLESRISSLIREIDLLRDQNSLLTEEKKVAEQQSEAMEGELKSVTISSKSSRQQSELENIHLQNSMAEKMQQVLELQRELREKNQLIQAMSRQLEISQKKSDKKKISSFMKKLRKSSEATGVTSSPERGLPLRTSTESALGTLRNPSDSKLLPSTLASPSAAEASFSLGHKEKSNGNRNRSRSTPADLSKILQGPDQKGLTDFDEMQPRSQSYHQLDQDIPQFPENLKGLSPSPTYPGSARRSDHQNVALMDSFPDYISDTGEPIGSPMRRSPETVQVLPDPPRKRKDYNIRSDSTGDSSSADDSRSDEVRVRRSLTVTSEQLGRGADPDRKRSHSSDRMNDSARFSNRRLVMSADGTENASEDSDKEAIAASPMKQSRRSSDPMPEVAPRPLPAPILPTPTSSPSVLSPISARNRSVQIHVTGPDDGIGFIQPHGSKKRSPSSKRSSSPGSPLPSPPLTTGTPTKSKSSKMLPSCDT